MLKKCLFILALLASLPGLALANTGLYPYLGAGVGMTVNTSNNEIFGTFRGAPVTIFAGMGGMVYQNLFMATEVTGMVFTGALSNQGAVKTSYGYAVSIMPGVGLCDHTILFARLGMVSTHFSDVSLPNTDTTDNLTGKEFGLGMQTALMQSIDIRGEYDFIHYGSLSAANYSASPRSDVATVSLVYKFV